MNIIPQTSQQISSWSGGTTTQLFIYPEHTEYAKRDFMFRISTATVETERSTFTSLPGFSRILMILKGELTIHHVGQYDKKLLPFETDMFDGSWRTSAEGLVTDFNIMFAQDQNASLTAHHLKAATVQILTPDTSFSFGYLVSGKALINHKMINTSDFVIFDSVESVIVHAETDCTWLAVELKICDDNQLP
jgi:environmental stress-induced protein Ves